MGSEHALEQAIKLDHGGTERLNGDRAEIELLHRDHAARLCPRLHLLKHCDRILQMHEEDPAEHEVERRPGHRFELKHVGIDLLKLGAFAGRRAESAWAPSLASMSMPVTLPCGPTRSAISR